MKSCSINAIPFDEGSFLDSKSVDFFQKVAADIHRGWHANTMIQGAKYYRQAAAAAKLEYFAKDGWNEDDHFLDIPREAYFYWVQREGPDFWDDEANRQWWARMHPECVRRNITGRTVITAETPWDLKRAIRAANNPEASRILTHVAA